MTDRQTIAGAWERSRVELLRERVRSRGLDGIILPRWDAHQSEYVLPQDERLAWATGFTGTWGLAVVLDDSAALFVDGRYTVQAGQEVDPSAFEIRHLYDDPPQRWLSERASAGAKYGYDPLVLNYATWQAIGDAVRTAGAELSPLEGDPVAEAWPDRPGAGPGAVSAFSPERAGEGSESKRRRLAERLREADLDLLVDSQADNLSWLLNVRSADLDHLPATQGFLIADAEGGLEVFVADGRLPRHGVELADVRVRPPEEFLARVRSSAAGGRRVGVDPRFAPVGAFVAAEESGGKPTVVPNPLTALKAIKNEVELAGMRNACRRDAAAWTKFLAWLGEAAPRRAAEGAPVTELEAEQMILAFRRELALFVSPSFRSISAAGTNAALCHYNAPLEGGAALSPDELYLLDSGGQFLDGTTDVTRTVCFQTPAESLRRIFTLVLKGHIALARQRFPSGTRGYQLDAFARAPLWSDRLDYDHGTGHGVGHFLSVHEHPQRIGKEPLAVPIEARMILTNEPGHYVAGSYGMRIENMFEVVEDSEGWLRLEPITFVPICLDLVDVELLDGAERAWLDGYHARTRRELEGAALGAAELDWLESATRSVEATRQPVRRAGVAGPAS